MTAAAREEAWRKFAAWDHDTLAHFAAAVCDAMAEREELINQLRQERREAIDAYRAFLLAQETPRGNSGV